LREGKDSELERIRVGKMKELAVKVKEDKSLGNAPMVIDDEHFDETVKKHSLMLIDCWADWCGPCRMIGPIIEELAKEMKGKIVFWETER
jgi:thioredoxin 1